MNERFEWEWVKIKIALIALSFLIATSATYVRSQNGRLWVDSQSTGLCLTKGDYRSWTIRYSHGHQLQPDGTWKNIWKRPTFHHVDIGKYIESGEVKFLLP